MGRLSSYPVSNPAHAHRLRLLAASIAAFRHANGRRRRIPRGLRAQVVAAVDAGIAPSAVARACELSRGQVTRWRSAAAPAVMHAPAARVLSVVDRSASSAPAPLDAEVEVRIGPWRVRLSRAGDAR